MRLLPVLVVATTAATLFSVTNADLQDLFRVDCLGVVSFLPDTPFGIRFDAGALRGALETFNQRVYARAVERCPTITHGEVKRRMVPSLDMFFNFLSGSEKRSLQTNCLDNLQKDRFVSNALNLGPFPSLLLNADDACDDGNNNNGRNSNGREQTLIDASSLLPTTCLSGFAAGTGCLLQVEFAERLGKPKIQFAADNCPGIGQAWPYGSVTCGGDICKNMLKPCTSNNDCGTDGQCDDIAAFIQKMDANINIENLMANGLKQAGIMAEQTADARVWDLVILKIRQYLATYFVNAQVGNKPDYLKICLPKQPSGTFFDYATAFPKDPNCQQNNNNNNNGGGSVGRRLRDYVDSVLTDYVSIDKTGDWTYYIDLVKTVFDLGVQFDDYRRNLQQGGQNNGGGGCGPDINQIFKTTNGANLQCNSTTNVLLEYACPAGLGNGVSSTPYCSGGGGNGCKTRCLNSLKVRTGDPDSFAYKCDVASNGLCPLRAIGNGVCNAACNIAACNFDSSDCAGSPAEIILEQNAYNPCANYNLPKYLVSTAQCADPANSCAIRAIDYEENNWSLQTPGIHSTQYIQQVQVQYTVSSNGHCQSFNNVFYNKDSFRDHLCVSRIQTHYCQNGNSGDYHYDPVKFCGNSDQDDCEKKQGYSGNCEFKVCSGQWIAPNPQQVNPPECTGTCFCNAQLVDPKVTPLPKNLFFSMKEISVSCNHLFAWDGIVNDGSSVLDLARKTPQGVEFIPPTRDETPLVGFSCSGQFQMGFMVPILRADATNWLNSAKALESAYIALVKQREIDDSNAGKLIKDDGYSFTNLGTRLFGVYTLGFGLFQQSTEFFGPKPAEWNYYKSLKYTPPGINMTRSAEYADSMIELPTTCNYGSFVEFKQCLVTYVSPVLSALGINAPLFGSYKACPGTNFPTIITSLQGDYITSFPFTRPCGYNTCAQGGKCVDMFQQLKTQNSFRGDRKLAAIDYDVFTFLLFGAYGRDPNWVSHQAPDQAWITGDFLFLFKNLFGGLPFVPADTYTTGAGVTATGYANVSYCFPVNDVLFTPLMETGKPFDFDKYIQQNNIKFIQLVDSKIIPGFNNGKPVTTWRIVGFQSTNYFFGGATAKPTAPVSPTQPTNKPTQTAHPTLLPTASPLPPGQTHKPTVPTNSKSPTTAWPTTQQPSQIPTSKPTTKAPIPANVTSTKSPTKSGNGASSVTISSFIIGFVLVIFSLLF